MCEFRMPCRFQRTPVPFCSRSYFDRIRKKPIDITAIQAIDFLDPIQIIQKTPLVNKIVLSSYTRDPIKRKCRILIGCQENIENDGWDNHHIDEWDGEDMPDRGIEEHPEKTFPEMLVLSGEFLQKNYPLLLDRISVFSGKSIVFFFDIPMKRLESIEKFGDF